MSKARVHASCQQKVASTCTPKPRPWPRRCWGWLCRCSLIRSSRDMLMPRGTCCRGDAGLRLSKVCLQDCFLLQDAPAFPQGAYKQALQRAGQSEG